MSEVRAAPRDASWYAKPGVARKFHIYDDVTGGSVCGLYVLAIDLDGQRAVDVHAWLRCHRNGCRQRWP